MLRRAWKSLSVAAAVAALVVAPSASGAHKTQSMSYTTLERGVLAQINAFRRSHGLSALRLSSKLSAAAVQHTAEMARDGYFAHESADGSSFDKRLRRYYPMSGCGYWSVGENLLWSSPDVSAPQALQVWLNSAPHRENLMTPRWRKIGIAAVHVPSAGGSYGGMPVTIITTDFGVCR